MREFGTSVTRNDSSSVHGRHVGHLMLLLTALLMLFCNGASAQGVTHIKGDVNEDGEVNAEDIVALVDIIMKKNSESKEQFFSKVLVIGNSVTRHGYAEVASVMWLSDDKGMAATTIDNDFCQFVEEGLKKKDKSAQVTRGFGVYWESNLPTDHNTLMGYLDNYNDDYDLIIFACSENIESTDGDEIYLSAREFFKVILEKWPKAKLLVTSTRLCKGQAPDSEYSYKDIALQRVATEMNLDFVDVRQRDNDAFVSDFTTGEWVPIYAIGDNGLFVIQEVVYWHTCDIGMLRIANSILSALDYPTIDNVIHQINVTSNQDFYAPQYWVRNGLVTVLCYDCIPQSAVATDDNGNSVPCTIKDMTSESLWGTPSRIPKAAVIFTMADSNVTLQID